MSRVLRSHFQASRREIAAASPSDQAITTASPWRRVEVEAWPAARPLYNLPEITARPDAPVVVCEGEKAAEAAARVFPECVVTTSSGGSGAPNKTDFA